MHIKPSDGAMQTRPPSIRPAAVSTLTSEAPASLVNLSISGEVRALSTLLSQALPALGPLHLLDVLTPQDRLMLARAVEFVASEGIALSELRKLVIDLGLYRLQTATQRLHAATTPALPTSTPEAPEAQEAQEAQPLQRAPALPNQVGARLGPGPWSEPRDVLMAPLGGQGEDAAPPAAAPPYAALPALAVAPEPHLALWSAAPVLQSVQQLVRAAAPQTAAPPPDLVPSLRQAPPEPLGTGADVPQLGGAVAPARDLVTGPLDEYAGVSISPRGVKNAELLAARIAPRGTLTPAPAPRTGAPLAPALAPTPSDAPAAQRVTHTPLVSALRVPPLFSPQDEQLARAILGSLALHDTLVDPQFVRALLDPDRTPEHAVDLGFLRRLVVALSASHADGACDPRVSGERREARTLLSEAVARLSVALGELPALSELDPAQGAMHLRQRLQTLLASSPAAHAAEGPELPTPLDRTPPPQAGSATQTPAPERSIQAAASLSRGDRALLSLLYAAAKSDSDLARVDDVVLALNALRAAERRERPAASTLPRVRLSTPPKPAAAARPSPVRSTEPTGRTNPEASAASAPSQRPVAPAHTQSAPPSALRSAATAPTPPPHAREHTPLHVAGGPTEAPRPEPPRAPSIDEAAGATPTTARGVDPLQTRVAPQPGAELGGYARADAVAQSPGWEAATTATREQGEPMRAPVDPSRNYGSSSQLAAKVAGSYARIARQSAFPPALAPRGGLGTESAAGVPARARVAFDAAREPPPVPTLTRPLSVAEALGVGALVRELKARTLRTARLRKRHFGASNVRPLEGLREAAYDAEADDPVLEAAPRRRRVRWHLLLERRKRRRAKER